MIKIYTGVPGSGKSLHAIQLVLSYLKEGKNVIANFPIKADHVKNSEKNGSYYYQPNEKITVQYLYQFMNMNHVEDEENQTLLIIDEASVKFNCRTSIAKDRLEFCNFFAQHRKFGYTVVLISQNLRQIDRQIRDLVEIEVIHRKMNNYSVFRVVPFSVFIAIEKNIVMKSKNDHQYFFYNRYYGSLYDTFYDFTRLEKFEDNQKLIDEVNKSLIMQPLEKKTKKTKKKMIFIFKNLIDRLKGCVSGAPEPVQLDNENECIDIFDDWDNENDKTYNEPVIFNDFIVLH